MFFPIAGEEVVPSNYQKINMRGSADIYTVLGNEMKYSLERRRKKILNESKLDVVTHRPQKVEILLNWITVREY